MLIHLLGISLPFHFVYTAVFGVAFLYSGSLWFLFIVENPRDGGGQWAAVYGVTFLYSGSWWFLFIVEVPPCGWDWTGGLSRFSG